MGSDEKDMARLWYDFQSLTHENRESAGAPGSWAASPTPTAGQQPICAKKWALSFNKCEIQVTIDGIPLRGIIAS